METWIWQSQIRQQKGQMMTDEEAILNELKEIVNVSGKEIEAEFDNKPLEQFVHIESAIFNDYAYDDDSYMFSMEMIAKSIAEVDELKKTETVHSVGLDPQEIHNRAMRVSSMAQGDIYTILDNLYLSFRYADDENVVGVIVRMGVFVSKTAGELGIKPCDAPDRENGVLTCLCSNDEILMISRTENSDEVIKKVVKIHDIEQGEQKLLDALMHFYFLPLILKRSRPKIFRALMKDYEAQQNNNQNDEGETQ